MALFSLRQVRFREVHIPDMDMQQWQTTFIVGPSGSGKTTLLRLLNGVISPDEGTVEYQGKNVAECDPIKLRREVLLAGQVVYLFDTTIRENFATFYGYRDLPAPDAAAMEEYLRLCVLDFPLDTPCGTMSGGERQRVFLAICLSFLPKVLLLDEPTSALDDANANVLLSGIKNYCKQKGITLIVVSHNRPIAEKYADAILNFDGGEVDE